MQQQLAHQLTQNVKLLQKAALWHNGKVLIVKRSSDSVTRPDKWDLPGGNSEWPITATENLRDLHVADLQREVFEETGIEITSEQVTKCVYIGTYFDFDKDMYSLILGWKVELPDDFSPASILLSDEHQDFGWMTAEEFDQYDFGFAGETKGFIREIIVGS